MARRHIDDFAELMLELVAAPHHRLMNAKLEAVEAGEIKRLMIFMPPGHAKALALDTPIPTPSGWTTMGRLRVGDRVFDEGGRPCRVTRKSPVWRDRPVYAVKTDCGDTIIADATHEWLVRLCGKRPVFKLKETHKLARKRAKRPMIQRAAALGLPAADLSIDPYLLGVWLGDGTSSQTVITCGLGDQVWMLGEISSLGYSIRQRTTPTLLYVSGVRSRFTELGLINDPHHNTTGRKHIPPAYLRASVEQRLALLQGLVDTDGTVSRHDGNTYFCNTNRELAENVRELVRSLGVKAGWSETPAVLNGEQHGIAYRVSFYHERAARLPRKAALCRGQQRTPNTYLDVEPAGIEDTVCIEVDSPSHLFLCGRSMTPTHNSTYASFLFPAWYIGRNPGKSVIFASHTGQLAERWGRKVRNLFLMPEWPWPEIELAADSQAAGQWETNTGCEYFACGVGGAVTGRRADLALLDDPLKGREDADSETIRDKLWDWYLGDLRTRLKPDGAIILIQTRWHDLDLAGRLLPENYNGASGTLTGPDGDDWEVICLPALAEVGDPLQRTPGEALWPDWFPRDKLLAEQRAQQARNWTALYQQRPAPEEGGYFKEAWLRWYDEEPTHIHKYGASDYAVTDHGGDYTVHGVFGIDPDDNIYVLDWWRAQTDTAAWVEALLDMMAKHKPFAWAEPREQIRRSMDPIIKKRMRERKVYCIRRDYSEAGDKPTKARSIQARMEAGKVYLPKNAPWKDDLVAELLHFPAGVHDDQVDVLSLLGRMLDRLVPGKVPPDPQVLEIRPPTLDELLKLQPKQDGEKYERI